MDLQQLEQFIMIEKSKSMRLAAEKLFLTQPTLSHNLKKLEDEMGCRLFERSRNQLLLNPCGEIFLEHALRITQEVETAKRRISEECARQKARFLIGCHAYAFSSFILPQLANFLKGHVLESKNGSSVRLLEELKSGALDIVFTDLPGEDASLSSMRLFSEQIMVSLPSSSELGGRACLYIDDLKKLDIYLLRDTIGYTEWLAALLDSAGIDSAALSGGKLAEYIYTKDNIDKCHLTSSFIMRFVPTVARRVLIPLADSIAARDIFMVYKKADRSRLEPVVSCIEQNKELLFNSNSFLPYFLFPGESNNLIIRDEVPV